MFSESVLFAFLSAVLVPASLYTYFLCCQLFIIYVSLVANEHFENVLIGSQRIWSNLWLFLVFEFYLGSYSWEIFSPRIEIAYSLSLLRVIFILYGCMFCLYVCVTSACLKVVAARRGQWFPWNWNYRPLCVAMWVLGTKPTSSVTTASIYNQLFSLIYFLNSVF